MATGTMESYVKTEGAGRIRTDDGKVYPVKRGDVLGDHRTLEHGDRVEFRVDVSDGQARAVEVHRV